MALIRAAKDIEIAATATQIPVSAGVALGARGSVETRSPLPGPEPPPLRPPVVKSRSISPSTGAFVVDTIALVTISLRRFARGDLFGRRLHHVITVGAFHTNLLRAVADNKMPPAEIVKRGR